MLCPSRSGPGLALLLAGLLLQGGCHWQPRPAAESPPPEPVAPAPAAVESAPSPAPDARPAPPRTADLWEQVRAGLRLGAGDHPRVQRAVDALRVHPRHVAQVSARALPYLYEIVAAVEARDLPLELALVPAVESGFRPEARSRRNAAGLWQIMPATGLHLGLARDEWVDARGELAASTRAALDYLEYLHARFDGDWLLALAAYNAGEGTVARALRRNRAAGRPRDYFSLELPAETERYVPRILGFAELVRHPGRYGVHLAPVPARPALETVAVTGPVVLDALAAEAGTSPALLAALNPGLRRGVTPPGRTYALRAPAGEGERIRSALERLPDSARVAWDRHQVRQGETLSHLALRYGASVGDLKSINGLDGDALGIGQVLKVPRGGSPVRTAAAAPGNAAETVHEVRRGDSLWRIARRYRTSVELLARANGLGTDSVLQPGQRLRVHRKPGARDAEGGPGVRHRVRQGESLWVIARRYGVSVHALRRWNALAPGALLQPGDSLVLHPGGELPQQSI